jgi:peptidoglycan/LPS O-acetylase OafA/YrhL
LLVTGQFYTPWSCLPRIVMQFTAGALACAAVRKLRLTERARRGAGYLSVLLVAATVGILYFFDAHPLSGVVDSGGLVDVLFVPLVMALTVGVGSLPALLSTRLLVYGGQISFCLYMVHELVHTAWDWAAMQFEVVLQGAMGKWIIAGLLAIAVAMSMLLFHAVEEPARRWMRSMAGVKRATVRSEPFPDPIKVELDPVEEILDARRTAVPVSAM